MKSMIPRSRIFLLFFFLCLLIGSLITLPTPATALDPPPDQVIINSQDWQDVYSGMLFGNLYGVATNFLVSTKHATILLYGIPTTRDNVLVLSNRQRPFIAGYEDILRSRGYDNPTEIRSGSFNLRLAQELAADRPGINKYIVIDDAYGYNAISVGPYAALAQYYVLFANRDNIDEVIDFLAERDPDDLILYGQLDREVKDGLAQFNPETINLGNRFDNNIEIVKRYQAIDDSKQVILTNGEFIEAGLLSGQDPVLFLGRENVPDQIREFIRESDIEVGILIGNELVGSATFVRRQLGISVFVKFAQGARKPTGPISLVEDLDRFPMPRYIFNMDIVSAVYNRGTGALEVTYRNLVDMALYFKSTITLRDGTEIKITGDEAPVFLDGSEYKTILYRYDIDGNPLNLQAEDLSGDVFTVFGEGALAMENTIQKSFAIDIIDVLDDSLINITDLYYDSAAGQFFVEVENVGDVGVYVNLELIDLIVNDEKVTVGADETVFLEPGENAWVPISIEMTDADIEKNTRIRVRGYYGERELALVKIAEATFDFRFGGGYGRYAMYTLIVVVLLLLLFLLATKKKCKECGYKNPRGRKTCQKCGHKF